MPLGAARIAFIAKSQVTAVAEVIRAKVGVTALGNAQIDTAQSKFGGSSALFDGNEDYLKLGETSQFAFGTGDFTIECWFRLNGLNATQIIWDQRSQITEVVPSLYVASDNRIKYYTLGNPRITGDIVTTGVWYHVAVVHSGSETKLYLNGTQTGSTYSDSSNYITGPITIGRISYTTGSGWNGHLDELRVSNTARYTANFTPSTTPFQNDDNTLLLLHMDGTDGSTFFEDDNGVRSKVGISAIGNAQVDTAQSKFGGASAVFDGTGDYLKGYPEDLTAFGTDNFTMEGWFRLNSTGIVQYIFDGRNVAGSVAYAISWQVRNDNKIYVYSNGANRIISSSTLTTGTWYHIAIVRNGDTMTLYLNGSSEGTWTGLSAINFVASQTLFGTYHAANAAYWNGWMDEIRFSTTARYTASFTAPTAPFVNDDNTLLLLHMNGTDGSTDFIDDNGVRASVGVSAVGNAQIDTAQSKFGGASAVFDGTNDKLQIAKEQLDFINGTEWTIEGWIYRTAGTGSFQQVFGLWDNATAANRSLFIGCDNDATDPEFVVYTYDSGGTIDTSVTSDGGTSIANNTWYHFAVVKDATNLTLYLNGTSQDSASSTTYRAPQIDYTIGSTVDDALGFAGNIDEIRVSNTARYTAAFTPATEPFQNDDNTLLLLHMNGTDGSTVFLDDNGVTPNYNYGA